MIFALMSPHVISHLHVWPDPKISRWPSCLFHLLLRENRFDPWRALILISKSLESWNFPTWFFSQGPDVNPGLGRPIPNPQDPPGAHRNHPGTCTKIPRTIGNQSCNPYQNQHRGTPWTIAEPAPEPTTTQLRRTSWNHPRTRNSHQRMRCTFIQGENSKLTLLGEHIVWQSEVWCTSIICIHVCINTFNGLVPLSSSANRWQEGKGPLWCNGDSSSAGLFFRGVKSCDNSSYILYPVINWELVDPGFSNPVGFWSCESGQNLCAKRNITIKLPNLWSSFLKDQARSLLSHVGHFSP